MKATISHGLSDCQHIKPISVISSFDCEGNIMPLYVRIDGEALKVHNAYRMTSTMSILNFNCEIMDGDTVKPLKLSYHIRDLMWTIPR